MNVLDRDFKNLLSNYKKITVIGLSPDPTKPSHKVPQFMHSKGYEIVGVYPKPIENSQFKIVSQLSELSASERKFINVFRKSENIPDIVDEIISLGGTEVLWLQLGITHPEAEAKAESHGIRVVSNRCLHIEYVKYF